MQKKLFSASFKAFFTGFLLRFVGAGFKTLLDWIIS